MAFHEHHFRNLGRARDHLTETIVSLQSATERMTGDDWIDATALLNEFTEDIGPRLARLRTAASDRFDEHTRHERLRGDAHRPDAVPRRAAADRDATLPRRRRAVGSTPPPRLEAPNAKRGAPRSWPSTAASTPAMMAYPPDSPEFDDIQAYRYVSTGKRPKGWIPPIV